MGAYRTWAYLYRTIVPELTPTARAIAPGRAADALRRRGRGRADSDPIFSPRVAESIARWIPGAGPAEIVAGASHFLQEEKGPEIGARIARFLAET